MVALVDICLESKRNDALGMEVQSLGGERADGPQAGRGFEPATVRATPLLVTSATSNSHIKVLVSRMTK